VKPTLLFDLDDTLVVEEPAATASFAAAAQTATAKYRVDAERLALTARERARELWYATPVHPYCLRVGISSWEGLWCRFEGEAPEMQWLRKWSPRYRREVWNLALADQGVQDPMLAEELGERYDIECHARHHRFSDVPDCLDELSDSYTLGLITNGASCLQREKLATADLDGYFDVVVVSAEFGVAKPDPSIFRYALSLLGPDREESDPQRSDREGPDRDGPDPKHAVMIGDSLTRDVDGAIAAGLQAVWLNRTGQPRPTDRPNLLEVTTLTDLPAVLGSTDPAPRTTA
jgi:putative hydrolase of the HAD superfamily